MIRERMLYPRSLMALSKEELAALEAQLLADPIAMLISGTALAVLYTQILKKPSRSTPQAAFGYSLGENSMMYATGVWGQGDGPRRGWRIRGLPRAPGRPAAGHPRISGACPAGDRPTGQPLWNNYLVMAAPEKVHAALDQRTARLSDPHQHPTAGGHWRRPGSLPARAG